MGEELAAMLHRDLLAMGPVTFRDWMRTCLYHPVHGYYNRPGHKTGAGATADFVTPPTLHPFLATAVAAELRETWERLGRPSPFVVEEHGGGEGDLARRCLAVWDGQSGGLALAARWVHHETSPYHRGLQLGSGDGRIGHAALGPPHVTVMVEVLDAIPADVHDADGNLVHVRSNDGQFELVRREGGSWSPVPEEDVVADQASMANWFVDQTLGGARHVLVIDYGDQGHRGGVRGFRAHHQCSVLEAPGDTDITYSIDFAQLPSETLAESSFESMEEFLLRHGILDELNAIDRSSIEGASSYLRLRQLLLPTGMGAAFKVARYERPAATTG